MSAPCSGAGASDIWSLRRSSVLPVVRFKLYLSKTEKQPPCENKFIMLGFGHEQIQLNDARTGGQANREDSTDARPQYDLGTDRQKNGDFAPAGAAVVGEKY